MNIREGNSVTDVMLQFVSYSNLFYTLIVRSPNAQTVPKITFMHTWTHTVTHKQTKENTWMQVRIHVHCTGVRIHARSF